MKSLFICLLLVIFTCVPNRAVTAGSGSNGDTAPTLDISLNNKGFYIDFNRLSGNKESARYEYMLEGIDESWQSLEGRLNISKLDPGRYRLLIRKAQNAEIENIITFEIPPAPWWSGTWAILVFFSVGSIVLFWIVLLVRRHERLKSNLKLEHLEFTHMQEVNKAKSRFFANISHELRTPLTLILDPLKRLYDREPHPKNQKQLISIIRSAQRLLQLINQLLDLSKLETGNMELETKKVDLVKWMHQMLSIFISYAQQRGINLDVNLPKSKLQAEFDPDKMEKILTNILTNALKFTPQSGHVTFKMVISEADNTFVNISVKDDGVGISEEDLSHVFDRFYQVNCIRNNVNQGTGIGLSLTKELVELHDGKIEIVSEPDQGTLVSISMPIVSRIDPIAEQDDQSVNIASVDSQISSSIGRAHPVTPLSTRRPKTDAPTILIVEDDPLLMDYMREVLEDLFHLKTAKDGKEALKMASDSSPDLIITDLMMPEMDGIKLIDHLKNQDGTCHIPIIVLTAKASDIDMKKGYETGADDYIIKPFNSAVLISRVRNILRIRGILREKYSGSKTVKVGPMEINASAGDEVFIKMALESIEKNMSNSEYMVEDFGNDVGLSRMQLYRKLKSLTGQSPNEFIRTIRLKRAAQLIQQGEKTISEITYEVGFNDHKYFRDCFKKYFGVNPSGYPEQNQHSTPPVIPTTK